MVNYWYIKIYRNRHPDFDEAKQYMLDTNTIGIGFGITEEYTQLTQDERRQMWRDYRNLSTESEFQSKERSFNYFINEMQIGDIVFLVKGERDIKYIATIDGNYEFRENVVFSNNGTHHHRRSITNLLPFEVSAPKRMVGTIYKV
jgi:predicted Mrr-cat superfamily restriction endonuclease